MSTFLREEEGPTWQQLLEEGKTCLSDAGVTESGLDAWYLLEASFGIDQVHFLMDRTRRVNRQRLEKSYPVYRDYLEKRASRIPIQHILGNQEFMGLEFTVDENVLIPRQDTEKLVETVLRDHKDQALSVLDMCTGSGCIAVSLAVLGGYDKVTAADISKAALKVAKKNVRRHFLVQKGNLRCVRMSTRAGMHRNRKQREKAFQITGIPRGLPGYREYGRRSLSFWKVICS